MKVKGSKSYGNNTNPDNCGVGLHILTRDKLNGMLLMDQPISGETPMASKP